MKSVEDLQEMKEKIHMYESEAYCLKGELKTDCWHPEKFVEDKQEYIEGGYDYRASTQYWQECSICGQQFNKRTKEHNWYG